MIEKWLLFYMTRSDKTVHFLLIFKIRYGLLKSEKVDTQPKQFLVKEWNLCSLVYILNKFESLKVAVKHSHSKTPYF